MLKSMKKQDLKHNQIIGTPGKLEGRYGVQNVVSWIGKFIVTEV